MNYHFYSTEKVFNRKARDGKYCLRITYTIYTGTGEIYNSSLLCKYAGNNEFIDLSRHETSRLEKIEKFTYGDSL